MPLYVFYPTRSNGLAGTFETAAFRSDSESAAHATTLLATHESAANVVVYEGQRQVAVVHRNLEPPHSQSAVAGVSATDREHE